MPSKSAKQHRFMEAVAHNPDFAREAGMPQSVGKDFAAADEAKSRASKTRSVSKELTRRLDKRDRK